MITQIKSNNLSETDQIMFHRALRKLCDGRLKSFTIHIRKNDQAFIEAYT